MCRFLKVSRSGYYDWLNRGESPRSKRNRELAVIITKLFYQHKGRYGSPRIHNELQKQGIKCGKSKVETLMRQMGLRAREKSKYRKTTDSKHDYPIAPNLLNRNFQVDAPNQVWVSDITYIRTMEGWLYLAIVMDLYSRKIVGWSMSNSLSSSIAVDALQMAIRNRQPRKGLIHHSDRGIQYACNSYRRLLQHNHLVCSMSRKGDCWDNSPAESFFSTLKIECINDRVFLTRAQAKREIFEYIEIDYNRKRSHSSIGYMSPENYENLRLSA
jgi:putative transposase